MTKTNYLLCVGCLATCSTLPGYATALTPWSTPVNVASVNSPANDLSPFLSPNGTSLFFASTRTAGGFGGEDLWVAHRSSPADAFGSPVNLGGIINTGANERSPALSADGLSLYFATNRTPGAGGFDLWVSKRNDVNDDLGWQSAVNLGAINSTATDAGPSHFFDTVNNRALLYFASNRGGNLDIYVSLLAPDGTPGSPSPVSELNTSANDLTPAVRADGLEMLFASTRGGASGLWASTRASVNDPWGSPVSLGPQFQVGSEAFPALSADGKELFFYSNRPGSEGFDIYRSVRSEIPEPGSLVLGGVGLAFLLVRRRGLRWLNRAEARRNVGLLAIAAVFGLSGVSARADTVDDWNEIMLTTIAGQNAHLQARLAAIVQVAVFESVNAIDREYAPYLSSITAAAGASKDAAVITAAHRVLRNYFASEATRLDAERDRGLAAIADAAARSAGIAVGESAADAIIALRANDGSQTAMSYTAMTGPGYWQPAPPALAAATLVHWGRVTPFGIASPYAFAVKPPPPLRSSRYTRDYNEVKRVGAAVSSERPQDRSDVARFVAMTSPAQLWDRAALQLCAAAGCSLTEKARALALLNMAMIDASITVFAAKYYFQVWRPLTAIREGDSDGNARTEPDAGFTPFIATPTFPAYPSAHASLSGAARYVLESLFGRGRHVLTLSNPALPGVTFSYTKLQQITDDIDDGRIYAGIHFRFDQDSGAALGRSIGRYVMRHNLRPLGAGDDEEDATAVDDTAGHALPDGNHR
jgi:hypothetical protein